MYQLQSQCGFIIPAIIKELKSAETISGDTDSLLEKLTVFDLESNVNLDEITEGDLDLLLVMHNLIIRGAPTFLFFDIEKRFAELLGHLKSKEKLGGLQHEFEADKDLMKDCWKALHLIDPRISKSQAIANYKNSWEDLDSRCEENFLFQEIPSKLFNGEGNFLIQLFQPQRSLDSMVEDEKIRRGMANNFREQQTDFTIEFPYYSKEEKRGICIEVDGPHHRIDAQKRLDKKRDTATIDSGWNNTFRFPVEHFGSTSYLEKFSEIQDLLQAKSIQIFKKNFDAPLYNTEQGKLALQLCLSPFAIARVQMAILKAILCGILSLDDDSWRIAVLEKDVPCAHLAIENFKGLFSHLALLEDKGKSLPNVLLSVYNTSEFNTFKLNRGEVVQPISVFLDSSKQYDLCIDIAMLERRGLDLTTFYNNANTTINIRSAYYPEHTTNILCGDRIKWRPTVNESDKKPHFVSEKVLTYFLQNVFRKKSFRPGQLPILHYALQNKTVIGLLPTGGGKSLTYQVASLLQPGIVLIIDPIKSLMKDQVDSLHRAGITRTVFINSSLKDYKERNKAYQKMQSGGALFCFVSPERLQMESFRGYLQEMYNKSLYFTYAVIDEVHCVSEWGHDFRTSYLALGTNLLEYCKAKEGKVSLFGLTATASFDVLADVQRELSGNSRTSEIPDENIIRHENTNRDEIQFIIDPVEISEEEVEIIRMETTADNFEWGIKEALGKLKQQRIQYWMENIESTIKDFNENADKIVDKNLIDLTYEPVNIPSVDDIFSKIQLIPKTVEGFWHQKGNNAGLVFAPHRTWYFGVTGKYTKNQNLVGIHDYLAVNNHHLRLGTYMGINDGASTIVANKIEDDNIRNQEGYLGNKLDVMVSTKAFGMGIDKPNIRFAIHNCYPGSIESFVQEAGRAGRDGKIAVSIVVFNNQSFQYSPDDPILEPDFDIQSYFYSNSFKGTEKEKAILFELLTRIDSPKIKNIDFLGQLLATEVGEYGENVIFKLRFSPEYNLLWLNDKDDQTYGFVNVTNGSSSTNRATLDEEIAQHCLNCLWNICQANHPQGLNKNELDNWLNQDTGMTRSQPGIEKVLEERKVGDEFTLTIPFHNDVDNVYERIATYCQSLNEGINAYVVSHRYKPKVEEFLDNLSAFYNWGGWQEKLSKAAISRGITDTEFKKRLAFRLGAKRDKSDTEKALYRLSLIGVIDEYTVDFRTGTFEIKVIKKTKDDYHNHLKYYLGKFYSEGKVNDILAGLEERKGNTDIQRMLNYLVEFIYEEIAKKRFQSIRTMQELCTIGIEQGNIEMKSWIHLYFNSKYARKGYSIELLDKEAINNYRSLQSRESEIGVYNVSLLDWTNEGVLSDIDWVFDFIQIVVDDSSNSQMDNLKHLRGACTRLLILNPDNYTLRLLRAYAAIILGERLPIKESYFQPIFEDLKIGILSYAQPRDNQPVKSQKVIIELLTEYKSLLLQQIYQYNLNYMFEINELIKKVSFIIHVNWAKQFEKKLSKQLEHQVT